jgi:hypothetical protein
MLLPGFAIVLLFNIRFPSQERFFCHLYIQHWQRAIGALKEIINDDRLLAPPGG